VWEQTSTPGINVLCTEDGCFRNCQLSCSGTFSLDPEEIRQKSWVFGWGSDSYCRVCYHYYGDHRHFRAKWTQKNNVENVTNYDARSKFYAAESLISTNSSQQNSVRLELQQVEQELKRLEGQLRNLCTQFQGLSLAGSFKDHLASTVRLLEVRLSTMKSGGANAATSKQMEARVEIARKKLAIVKAAV
jgi:hypothetical protein